MKRKVLIVFVVFLMVVIAGCGGEEDTGQINNSEKTNSTTATQTGDDQTNNFVIHDSTAGDEKLIDVAAEDPNITEFIYPYICRVRGKVIDWFGNTDLSEKVVSSVEVLLDGTQHSTLTNIDGLYILEVPEGTSYLKFYREGYLDEEVQIALGQNEPCLDLTTRLKPVIDGPVFKDLDRYYGEGFSDLYYVEYGGLAYRVENITGANIGPYNTIRGYDISDWYNVEYADIEVCPDANVSLGRLTVIDDEFWSCNSSNWDENIRGFSLPNLEEFGHWYFESPDFRTNNFIAEKDEYLIKVYTKTNENESLLDYLEIKIKYFDRSNDDLKIESEGIVNINELSPSKYKESYFAVRKINVDDNYIEITLKWEDNTSEIIPFYYKEGIITIDISNRSIPVLISCETKDI